MPLPAAFLALAGAFASAQPPDQPPRASVTIRVATFNIEDVRTEDVVRRDQPRVAQIARVIRELRPNIILLNELAYDMEGAPGFVQGASPGENARRFVENYLNDADQTQPQGPRYRAFMASVNTGVPSGFDLDNDGKVVTLCPPVPPTKPDGSPGEQTPEGRAYANDCWGFGTFPGQYAMALLVDERLTIDEPGVRTFRLLPWDYVPGAFIPTKEDGSPWFDESELKVARLSSKGHWDVPVKLPNGAVVHLLCSHPTPPAFDGPEMRNRKRNHDEIRFWADYIDRAGYIGDDKDVGGGLPEGSHFVVLGDLNADPEKGNSYKDPIRRNLLSNRLVKKLPAPVSDIPIEGLAPSDTARFKLRVDYVLPSATLDVRGSGVWRKPPGETSSFPSDHFPVWVDLVVPPPAQR